MWKSYPVCVFAYSSSVPLPRVWHMKVSACGISNQGDRWRMHRMADACSGSGGPLVKLETMRCRFGPISTRKRAAAGIPTQWYSTKGRGGMHTQTLTHTPRRCSTVVSTRAVLRPKIRKVSETGSSVRGTTPPISLQPPATPPLQCFSSKRPASRRAHLRPNPSSRTRGSGIGSALRLQQGWPW